MASGQTKALIAIAVAVMFGVMQIVCACMPVGNIAEMTDVVSSQHASHMPTPGGHHSVATQNEHMGHGAPSVMVAMANVDDSSREHGEHDHATDCAHCDSSITNSSSADVPTPSVYDLPQPDFLIATADPTPLHRAGMAATNLSGLRWRDPPRPTPVSLKTLALI